MRNPLEAVPMAVALVSNSAERGKRLKDLLQASGMDVHVYDDPQPDLLLRIRATPAAAIILDLDGGGGQEGECIDALVRQDILPVLFNDASAFASAPVTDRELGEQLRQKIGVLVGRHTPAPEGGEAVAAQTPPAEVALLHPSEEPSESPVGRESAITAVARDRDPLPPARQVWVLAASLGGPDAVKRFVARLPAGLPAAFVLAQRISAEFIPLLMEQIRRLTAMRVMSARGGHLLRHGELIVAPVERHLRFDEEGCIRLGSEREGDGEADGCPSINSVMAAVAARFGGRAGAIVFSGIGNDGVLGARSILEQGGSVWAQTADSCIMSSMPDHVRNACPVALNASPEDLAAHLVRQVGESEAPSAIDSAAN